MPDGDECTLAATCKVTAHQLARTGGLGFEKCTEEKPRLQLTSIVQIKLRVAKNKQTPQPHQSLVWPDSWRDTSVLNYSPIQSKKGMRWNESEIRERGGIELAKFLPKFQLNTNLSSFIWTNRSWVESNAMIIDNADI